MMGGTAVFSLTSELKQLSEILLWATEQLASKKLYPQELRKIELSLEEAVVNVIEHSYEGKGGELEISCHMDGPDEVVFVIKDSGPPFNPLAFSEKIQTEHLIGDEKRGGLGVILMCRAMDYVHYQRQGDYNVLTLTKKLRQHGG